MALTRELMIDRMLSSDADYNGRFLTGVLSTGIYCLPSCPARKPKPENVRFFRRPEDAEAAGLRACKRCRPQLFYRDRDPDRELVEDLVERLRGDVQAFRNVGDLVSYAGVGSSKLVELFRRHYHTTPSEMLVRQRVADACDHLRSTDRPIADIAFDVGFETLSVFNDNFRRLQRLSPQSYRRLACADSFEIELPRRLPEGEQAERFLADRVLAYVGRDPASLTERVEGQAFAFGTRVHGLPAAVHVELGGGVARCRVERYEAHEKGDASAVHAQVLRILGLAIDPRPFERRAARDAEIARLIRGRRGLSIPQTPTVFDALVWVIAGQQVSLPVAFAMRRRLTRRVGVQLEGSASAAPLYAPPTPESIAVLEPSDLHQLGWSKRKAEYLLDIARAVADGSFDPEGLAGRSATAIERELLAIRGLGPWSVNYLMMRAFGFADCVPIGDAALTRNLKRYFELATRPDARVTRQLMAPFAPHRSLATFHLWALKEESQ